MVYAVYESRRFFVLCRRGNHDLFGSRFYMIHSFFRGDICTGSFHYVFCSTFFPRDINGLSMAVDRNFFAVYDKSSVIKAQIFWESSESRVILEHIYQILKICISHINSCNFDLRHVHSRPYHNSRYSAKTADTNFNRHFFLLLNSLNDNIFNRLRRSLRFCCNRRPSPNALKALTRS